MCPNRAFELNGVIVPCKVYIETDVGSADWGPRVLNVEGVRECRAE